MSTTKLVKSVYVYNINKFIILISLKSIRATLYFLVKIIAWNSKAKYIVKDIVTESWVIILFFQLHVLHVVDNLTMHFPMFSKLFVGECTCAFELVGWNVTQCFWRKVICITLFCYYFPLKKGLDLTPSDQGCFMPSLVEIGRADPDRKKECCQFWHLLSSLLDNGMILHWEQIKLLSFKDVLGLV